MWPLKLPEGLVESDKLPEPIYTPSTKADLGDHDENISFEQSVDVLEKIYPGKGLDYATQIKDCTIALYKKCAEYALSKGIIIADTKFEFGLDENGKVGSRPRPNSNFSICNDNSFGKCILCTFLVESDGAILDLCCVIKSFSRINFLQHIYRLLKGNILIMIAQILPWYSVYKSAPEAFQTLPVLLEA